MKFKISIVDDTDDAVLENIKPVYDFLHSKGIRITKTVWVYPPRDRQSSGDSLQRTEYLDFIRDLHQKGFEIALHNVGSGDYTREEIVKGLEEFKDKLGFYPKIHINHSYNKDSIYGGTKRFNWPFNKIVNALYPQYAGEFQGEIEGSPYFWGDLHKEMITYNRNHEFKNLNTLAVDPKTPYIDSRRSKYSNYWFSSSFAPNQLVFNHLLSKENVDKLVKDQGTAIVFTHFGYFYKDGQLDPGFVEAIEYLVSQKGGTYLPVSELLDQRAEERRSKGKQPYPTISLWYKFRLELIHLWTRVYYRKFNKIDDYAFKGLDKDMFLDK
jgi:hypothetical protein